LKNQASTCCTAISATVETAALTVPKRLQEA